MGTNKSTNITQDLFQIVRRFSRLRMMDSSFMKMKPSEYQLLGTIYLSLSPDKEAFSVTELSNLLQITPAAITHLINPLEEGGYIERLEDPNDRRVVLIGLTNQGRETAKQRMAEVHKKLNGLIDHLGVEDSKTLIRLMSLVISYITSQRTATK